MSMTSFHFRQLQLKWILISMIGFSLLYLLPLMLLATLRGLLATIWLFAGPILLAALAGYLSKGVAIVEPAIASSGLFLLFFIGLILIMPRQINMDAIWIGMAIMVSGLFLLSLLGAWLGERAQKFFKPPPPEQPAK
jgi:hypothetical protein